MIIDNINFLKRFYPEEYAKCKDIETNIEYSQIIQDTAADGSPTLHIERNGYNLRIHSGYSPAQEAEIIIEQYKNINQYEYILFYGTGLGYHIDILLEKYPDKKIFIYEPVEELFYYYIKNRNLPEKSITNICISKDVKKVSEFIRDVLQKTNKHVLIVELPCHKNIFPSEHQAFFDLFKKMIKDKRISLHTNYAFQKRWIINSMINFKEVLNTPNILRREGEFKGKTAILVSAGPSLNDEINNLKYIKEHGLAYIFSVGSAINTLLHHDIRPHAACTYDPGVGNKKVFKSIIEQGIIDVPLIYGTSVGHELLPEYKGMKIHMITSQDSVSRYFLRSGDERKIDIVFDAPSIAVVTFQLLCKLGFSRIILVGQNFAYKGKRDYAEGIKYRSYELSEDQLKCAIKIKDVNGEDVLTNDTFNRMRLQLQNYIKNTRDVNVINTTRNGAAIEGTSFMILEECISKYLNKCIVEEDWYKVDKDTYDLSFLRMQLENINHEYQLLPKIIMDFRNTLSKIDLLARNNNFHQIEQMYIKLDKTFNKFIKNNFVNIFIIPMNRIHFELFNTEIKKLKHETNTFKKAEGVYVEYNKLVSQCLKDITTIEPIYEDMCRSIREYLDKGFEI